MPKPNRPPLPVGVAPPPAWFYGPPPGGQRSPSTQASSPSHSQPTLVSSQVPTAVAPAAYYPPVYPFPIYPPNAAVPPGYPYGAPIGVYPYPQPQPLYAPPPPSNPDPNGYTGVHAVSSPSFQSAAPRQTVSTEVQSANTQDSAVWAPFHPNQTREFGTLNLKMPYLVQSPQSDPPQGRRAEPPRSQFEAGPSDREPERGFRERAYGAWRISELLFCFVAGGSIGALWLAWTFLYDFLSPFLSPMGLDHLLDGFWMFSGVFLAYVVRKPGAAMLGAVLPAVLEIPTWGYQGLLYGAVQGLPIELVLLVFGYRKQCFTSARIALLGCLSNLAGYGLSFWLYRYYEYLDSAPYVVAIGLISGLVSTIILAVIPTMTVSHFLSLTGIFDRFRLITDHQDLWVLKNAEVPQDLTDQDYRRWM